jgi:hypothetical protein
MAKQRTVTGSYSESSFGGKGSKDKIRNVDYGPAEGVVKNPYSIKSFSHIDGDLVRGSGPVPTNAGRPVQKDRTPPAQNTSWDMSSKFLGKRGGRGSAE